TGVLGSADAVLAAGAAAVAQFEVGELTGRGVGGEAGDAVAVGVGDAQLRAGMGPFGAHDQSDPPRPAGEVDHVGDLGAPGALAGASVGVVGRTPCGGGTPASLRWAGAACARRQAGSLAARVAPHCRSPPPRDARVRVWSTPL